MSIVFTQKMISPNEAELLLESNKGNRHLNEKNVNFLYKQMAKGKWLNTSDTIKISKAGKLLDGQHRLAAIIKLGKPVKMTVAENLEENIFEVLDTGKTRSAGDVLSIKGFHNVNNLAGAARFIIHFKRGSHSTRAAGRDSKVTNSEILEFCEKNPELNDIHNFTHGIYVKIRSITSTVLTGLYYILAEKSQKDTDAFFEKYASGANLGETSPIRHLRERLIRDQINKTQLNQRDKVALFIYAWNAYRGGKKLTQLTLQKNYTFPKPI